MMNSMPWVQSICFVVDEPGWAFDRCASNWGKYLRSIGMKVDRYYRHSILPSLTHDIIFVCWWQDLEQVVGRCAANAKVICRIADMVTWTSTAPLDMQKKFWQLASHVNLFAAASEEIRQALGELGVANCAVVGDGVDTKEFAPRLSGERRSGPVAGWCGNPHALEWMGVQDIKGVSVITALKGADGIGLSIATDVPLHRMAAWYRSIDIYVCASRAEGTPLPVLEAMASGNVILSTSVGVVREMTLPGVKNFDGTLDDLLTQLEELLASKDQWLQLGMSNRAYITATRSVSATGMQLVAAIQQCVAG